MKVIRSESCGQAADQHLVQPCARWRQRLVHDESLRRRAVEQQHRVGEQAMATTEIDDPPAAKQPPHAPRGFPCLVELLAGQAAGVADLAGQAMKEDVAGKAIEVAIGQATV